MNGEAQAVFGRLQDSVVQVGEVNRDFLDAASAAIRTLPAPIAEALRAGIAEVGRQIDELNALLDRALAVPGNPWALWEAGSGWTQQVGGAVAPLAALATLDEVRVDEFWQGVAADAYRFTLPRQRDALAAVKAATDDLQDSLDAGGWAIVAFWGAVAAALVALILAVVGAIAAVAGGVTAPAAPALASAGLGGAITLIVAANGALTAELAALASATATLEQRFAADEAFPRGSWPRSTADLSDASLTDGDDTDWHIR